MNIALSAEAEGQLLAFAHAKGAPVCEDARKPIREDLEARRYNAAPQVRSKNRTSAFGKDVHVPGGSESFARENEVEIDREARVR